MPTYNSGKHLERCLLSLRAQTYENWKLYCVDRGSTDGSVDILTDHAKSWDKLVVVGGGDERTSQINIAVRQSRSEYLYYTASDFFVDPILLEESVRVCRESRADGAWINCVSYGDGFWARVRNLERSTYFGSEKFEGVRFFRRDAYVRVGGYDDEVPIFEEYDLQDRLLASGARIARVLNAAEYHLGEPEKLSEIASKSYYYGTRYVALLKKQGAPALRHANPLRSTFLKHWRSFASRPILTLGFLLMLAVKYGSGAAGAAVAFVESWMRRPKY